MICLIAAINITVTNIFLIEFWENFSEPNFDPIYPPIRTAIENGIRVEKSKASWPDTVLPISPEKELTQINTAETKLRHL